MQLENKVVAITGGAQGLGMAMAKSLAAKGAKLALIDINKDEVPAEEQASPEEEFGSGLEDQDETGRNMAFQSFKKIEKGVLDSYELLQDPDDKKLFYDYLLANLKLYFDRFESELSTDVTEPESAEYEQAKEPEPTASNDLNLEI